MVLSDYLAQTFVETLKSSSYGKTTLGLSGYCKKIDKCKFESYSMCTMLGSSHHGASWLETVSLLSTKITKI